MPTIEVFMQEGKTRGQKKALIEEITKGVVKALNVEPEIVTIMIIDMPKQNIGVGGKMVAD